MTTVSELFDNLESQIDDTNTLVLTGTALDSANIQTLIDSEFAGGSVSVRECTLTRDANRVRITGQSDAYGLRGLPFEAELVPSNGTVEATFALKPSIGESLLRFVPEIGGSFLEDLEFVELTLVLCSRDGGATGIESGRRAGKNLRARAKLPAFMQAVTWLLNDETELALEGPLPAGTNATSLDLVSTTVKGVQLGYLDVDVTARIVSIDLVPSLFLVSQLEFGDPARRTLQMSLHVPVEESGLLTFDVDTEGVGLSDLRELAAVVNTDVAVLPAEIPVADSLELSRLSFVVSPAAKRLVAVSARVGSARTVPLIDDIMEMRSLDIDFMVRDPVDDPQVAVAVTGRLALGNVELFGHIQLPDMAVSAGLTPGSRIDVTSLLSRFLPDAQLPEFDIVSLQVRADPSNRQFHVECALAGDWSLTGGGSPSLVVRHMEMGLHGHPEGTTAHLRGELFLGTDTTLVIEGEVAETVVLHGQLSRFPLSEVLEHFLGSLDMPLDLPEIEFQNLSFSATPTHGEFSLQAEAHGNWSIADLTADRVTLSIERTRRADGSHDLSCDLTCHVATLQIAERVALESFDLLLHRSGGGEWSATGDVAATVFDAGFTLSAEVAQSDGKRTIRLSTAVDAHAAPVRLPLPVPATVESAPSIALHLGRISVANDAPDGGWRLVAETALSLTGMPLGLQQLLPHETTASIEAGGGSVKLTTDRLVEPFHLRIPDLEVGDSRVPLGDAMVDASNLSIRFGRDIDLTLEFALGLPHGLNRVFGVKEDGQTPAFTPFVTYNPAQPGDSVVRLAVDVGSDGIAFKMLSSPLRAIRLEVIDGDPWWNCDLDEFGAVMLKVPVLFSKGGDFSASGGMDIVRPLRLPLTPIKLLLSLIGLEDALPDSVPLRGIDLVDDRGEFKVDALLSLLGAAGPLPVEITDAVRAIGKGLDRLPDAFKDYLAVEIPNSLLFDISVTASGGVRFDVRVMDGDPPIRHLLPTMVGPFPALSGFELRGVAFGALFGGSLFQLEIDARFDQFDLITLAASLLLPQDGNIPLPDSRTLQKRVILDKLFMIVVYQTVIPIPIPLFYDQLGIEYLGIEGVQLQTHVSFPLPSLNLRELTRIISGFVQFFTKSEYLLDTESPPKDMNLSFTLGSNYVRLPRYLGGRLLGSQTDVGTVDAYSCLANLMNGLKTFELNSMIQGIPLEKRVGHSEISFGPLSFEAAWAITTPAEFQEKAYARLALADNERSAAMKILPADKDAPANHEPQGLIIFLKGGTAIEHIASFDMLFGLMASGSSGFSTGVRINGSLANALELEISGVVYVDPGRSAHDSYFGLEADGRLTLNKQVVLLGRAAVDDQSLTIAGKVDLFPGLTSVKLAGDVLARVGRQGFLLRGRVHAHVLGISADTDLTITHAAIAFTVQGNIFDLFKCRLALRGGSLDDAGGLSVSATMQNDLFEYLRREATKVIQAAVQDATNRIGTAQRAVDDALEEVKKMDSQISSMRNQILAERRRNGKALADAQAAVATAQQSVDDLQSLIDSTKRRISVVKKEINAKYRWYQKQPWYNKTWAWSVYASYAAARNAEIAALNVKIGGIETAKWTAMGALEVAKQSLRAAKALVDTFPIDADARMVVLYGARETAQAVLNGARIALSGVQSAVGIAGSAATFIVRAGLGGLLDVRAASFHGSINAVEGGKVSLSVTLSFMERPPTTMALAFDFKRPLAGAQSLGRALLAG